MACHITYGSHKKLVSASATFEQPKNSLIKTVTNFCKLENSFNLKLLV